MAVIRPFRALRPVPAAASAVAAVPYDVVSTDEARALAAGNPLSFLHVSRAEIDLSPHADPYGDDVYRLAATNLETLTQAAPLVIEDRSSLYLYRLRTADHEQTGLAGCFSLDEYDRQVIKRHEHTRRDKENDRTRHTVAVRAQTGIVYLAYRARNDIDIIVDRAIRAEPCLDVVASDAVRHTIWCLDETDQTAVTMAFKQLPALYIADGHHRVAGAARAREKMAATVGDDPEAEARFFLGVAFPDNQTRILPYNRTVDNLAGLTPDTFIDAVAARFPLQRANTAIPPKGTVAMYLNGCWHAVDVAAASTTIGSGPRTARLDVSLLQDQVLAPLLGITDVRADPRITFVGGARGTAALERMVDLGTAAVAFSLAPVTTEELLAISDAGDIMPPKSTWFDPKLRDGLLIHRL